MTRERPVELVVEVDSRPVMPWIAVSIGVDTSVFTTSGDAPAYDVTIESWGNSTEGASSCLRPESEIPPKIATTDGDQGDEARDSSC